MHEHTRTNDVTAKRGQVANYRSCAPTGAWNTPGCNVKLTNVTEASGSVSDQCLGVTRNPQHAQLGQGCQESERGRTEEFADK